MAVLTELINNSCKKLESESYEDNLEQLKSRLYSKLSGEFPFNRSIEHNIKLRKAFDKLYKNTISQEIQSTSIELNQKEYQILKEKYNNVIKQMNQYKFDIIEIRNIIEGNDKSTTSFNQLNNSCETFYDLKQDIQKIKEFCIQFTTLERQESFETPLISTPPLNIPQDRRSYIPDEEEIKELEGYDPNITVDEAKRRNLLKDVKEIKAALEASLVSNQMIQNKIAQEQKEIRIRNGIKEDKKTSEDEELEKDISQMEKELESNGQYIQKEIDNQTLIRTDISIVETWDFSQLHEYQNSLVQEYSRSCIRHNFLYGKERLMASILEGKSKSEEWKKSIELVIKNADYHYLVNEMNEIRKSREGIIEKRESVKMQERAYERKKAISSGRRSVSNIQEEACDDIKRQVEEKRREVENMLDKYDEKLSSIKKRERELVDNAADENEVHNVSQLQNKKKERFTLYRQDQKKSIQDMKLGELRSEYERLEIMKNEIIRKEKVMEEYEKELTNAEKWRDKHQEEILKNRIEKRIDEEENKIQNERKKAEERIQNGEEDTEQYKGDIELLTTQCNNEKQKKDELLQETIDLWKKLRERAGITRDEHDQQTQKDYEESVKRVQELKNSIGRELTLKEQWYKAKYDYINIPISISRIMGYKERWENEYNNKLDGTGLFVNVENVEKYNESVNEEKFYESVKNGTVEELMNKIVEVPDKETSEEEYIESEDEDLENEEEKLENEKGDITTKQMKHFKPFDEDDVQPYEKKPFTPIDVPVLSQQPSTLGEEIESTSQWFQADPDDVFAKNKEEFVQQMVSVRDQLNGLIIECIGLMGMHTVDDINEEPESTNNNNH
ncbi:nuclease sbcCD subunit C, putative [Entamoeba dispar SAW760]|uniref:Nuclease sbcCD subunit C, putative n=1 Tax=Entamoeba dispar (strain ATCC PRA-260 / SAW760) TaxID=370354 RepID=B0ESM1_ENTDS|nr:nuclease sbcCD subunit C, putative [Entamoeba dispar SAW760]EDR22476.1 nuclease sbcCD subunit C, putative [Entamoeba dispar SAW760]|eukprot:EDR22476.1 nuclease sbcCD subunit C, putative [Entamoeba dispar SAW760]